MPLAGYTLGFGVWQQEPTKKGWYGFQVHHTRRRNGWWRTKNGYVFQKVQQVHKRWTIMGLKDLKEETCVEPLLILMILKYSCYVY